MDSDENNRICGTALNTCSSGMVGNSGCDEVSGMTMCSANWDLFMSLNQGPSFAGSEFAAPHLDVLAHFASNPPLINLAPKVPSIGNEMIQSHGTSVGTRMASTNVIPSQQQWQNLEGSTPSGKRKRKNYEDMQQKNPTGEALPECNEDEKHKFDQNGSKNGNGAEPSKENYIHVRAKRGQATNSHSLAERVRREKISERMRLLQELVPGCNKITGKAMMLDEIINYVQSLQQQVEFLSMKLATVNPEMNLDIDHVLSKEVLQFPGSDRTMPMSASGLSPLHSFPRYPFNGTPGTIPPVLPLPQHMWNDEFHVAPHASFIPNPSCCSPASNGMPKTEL